MDKERFWQLIDEARAEAGADGDIAAVLVDRMAVLDIGDIMRWGRIFSEYQ